MAGAELNTDDLAVLIAVLRQSSTPVSTSDLVAALRARSAAD
jgi:hypothetical protein